MSDIKPALIEVLNDGSHQLLDPKDPRTQLGEPVTARKTLTGGIELSAAGVAVDVEKTKTTSSTEFYSGIGTQVLFDLSTSTGASGTGTQRIADGSAACPDPAYPTSVMQIGPSGIIDQALSAAVPSAGIDSIGFWARATRSSDGEKFASCKILISDSIAGFTNFGVLPFAVRADGKWRYHTVPMSSLAVGGGAWTIASDIGRIRFREGDAVATTGRPLMAGNGRVQFGAVRTNPRGKAAMLVRFDDGLDNLRSNKIAVLASEYVGSSGITIPAGSYSFLDLLNYFGFPGNAYVLTDLVGNAGFETWSGLQSLQAAGWSVCVQAAANPLSQTSDGARLLGPIGYNLHMTPGDVASVSSSVFTLAGTRPDSIGGTSGYVSAGGVQSFPVQVLGTPPAPLVSGQVYYALRRGVRTFSLHTVPVGLSPQDDSAGLVIITESDTSQMTLRYAGSANDATAIAADYSRAQAALIAHGLTGYKHIAFNQGAYDKYVEEAVISCGFRSSQTTGLRTEFIPTIAGHVAIGSANVATTPLTNGRVGTVVSGAFSIISVIQTDGSPTALDVRNFVADCVKYGSVGANYHHNTNNLPVLLAYLDQCKIFSDVGLLDVVNIETLQRRISNSVRNTVL